MTWTQDGKWHCEMCDQVVSSHGPWCHIYCASPRPLCRAMLKHMLRVADECGDGPMVNAVCQIGRQRYGEDQDW